jgi:hypothetical protein
MYLSSLYHYLSDHPRVLPAKEKQIHYFKVRLWPAGSRISRCRCVACFIDVI